MQGYVQANECCSVAGQATANEFISKTTTAVLNKDKNRYGIRIFPRVQTAAWVAREPDGHTS